MIVVTSGSRYIDIDAYACCVAYAELLTLLGKPAIAASTAPWNESITKSIRALGAPLATQYASQADDQFILVDLSDPEHFDKIVDLGHVIEVHDHHPGFETYWADKLGKGGNIEFIGAAATLIYEAWQNAGKTNEMSVVSAKLLAAAILDNTLNFGASVTTERDRAAYASLASHAGLDDAWIATYFEECQSAITSDLAQSLQNDTKFLSFAGLDQKLCLGQMVVWDARDIIKNDLNVIANTLTDMQETWMANVISISEGKSYFIAQNDAVKKWAENLLEVRFDGSVAEAKRLWLRKEIMKVGLAS